ncbi:histidine phosphatase family protein [Nocardioides humi]|nr:histidine phosphatase family protein [Nocardioides humi]
MSAPRRLVLLRHGRTAWNAEQRVQGQTDVQLDDTGLAQARAVAP